MSPLVLSLSRLPVRRAASRVFLVLVAGLLCCDRAPGQEASLADVLSGSPFPMPALREPEFPARTVSIADHGARGDGLTMNTAAFAAAISACAKAGGGTVLVPPGTWMTGPIKLESGVNLHLERGALVQFSRTIADFPLIPGFDGKAKRYVVTPPLFAHGATGIAITGPGVFNGAGEVWRYVKRSKLTAEQWQALVASGGVVSRDGKEWWPSQDALEGEATIARLESSGRALTAADYARAKEFLRPDMVRLSQCTGILIDGPTFTNSPRFHLHPVQSEQIIIRNVTVVTPWNAQNGDGIDLSACRNVAVYNCLVDVGDDAICIKPSRPSQRQPSGPGCENIVISGCTVLHGHGGFVVGSESFGGARNVAVRNCVFIGTDVGLRFKSARDRGGVVERIFIDGIQMRSIENEAILFDMSYGGASPEVEAAKDRSRRATAPVTDLTPRFRDIRISNVTCQSAYRALLVSGLPEMPVRGIRLENVRLAARKGALCIDLDGIEVRNSVLLPQEGPVLELHDARNVTCTDVAFPPGAEVFLVADGAQTEGVRLEKVALATAKQGIRAGDDVRKGAVVVGAEGQ